MHDCFGKPLQPFTRVRAATKEELEAQGHHDSLAGFDGELVMLTGTSSCDTCNVHLVEAIDLEAFEFFRNSGGLACFTFKGGVRYATARTLVKLEG